MQDLYLSPLIPSPNLIVFVLCFSTVKFYKMLFYADIIYLDQSLVNLFYRG